MKAQKHLTGFLEDPISRPVLESLLREAGLELWQAPEGFWTIRLRQPPQHAKPAPAAEERRR